jgi:threonyl-tRNA synthetase
MTSEPVRKTPGELLRERGQLADDIVAVRIGTRVVDLHTPIDPKDDFLPVRASDPDGLRVIRHSAAHVMADAVQRLFPGTQVTIGPAIDSGFYYDFDRPDGPFTEADLASIEAEMKQIISARKPFFREEVTREAAHALFEGMGEKFKLEVLDAIPGGEAIGLYRHGSPGRPEGTWVDLCEGPHVPNTGAIGAVKLLSVAGAYWRGSEKNPMLQRIYGTAFPDAASLETHLKLLEEARARDHRKLGKELELFMFHEWSPGMPFLLPRGAGVYNRLVDYLRGLYIEHGYEEVITPQVFDKRLFETSGHIPNFIDGLYFPVTAEALSEHAGTPAGAGPAVAEHPIIHTGLKPMNCPGHCLLFGHRRRSYRELPWRVADFGRLHRFERTGVMHGLARVRSFCQDDAHIFCTEDQAEAEAGAFTKLVYDVYRVFGMTRVDVKLALRPEHRLGSDEIWDRAESMLDRILTNLGLPFEKTIGEGAFYGPKIEFHVVDALGRSWQLGTIQLDYFLPERFGLDYVAKDGSLQRPIMLHRAVFGSLERFFAIYIEHVAGKFPTWLAPEQAVLVTVSEKQAEYAERVRRELAASGLRVAVDAGDDKLGAKIRNARLMRHPYVVVLGDKEAAAGTVAPRSRDQGDLGPISIAEFAARLRAEATPPRLGAP